MLCILLSLLSTATYAQSTAIWHETQPHALFAEDEAPGSDQDCHKGDVALPIQSKLEKQVAQSTFEVNYDNAANYYQAATAFLISPDVVVTNRHVLEEITGYTQHPSPALNPALMDPKTLEQMIRKQGLKLKARSPNEQIVVTGVEACLPDQDVCFLKIAPVKNRTPLKFTHEKSGVQMNQWLGMVGNIHGEGLKASSGHLYKSNPWGDGRIAHCIPTTTQQEGGQSGSPIFNKDGEVVAIEKGGVAYLGKPCKSREGVGQAEDVTHVLASLKSSHPDLYNKVFY